MMRLIIVCFHDKLGTFSFLFLQTGEKSGQVEKSKKNARQRQNDFKVWFSLTCVLTTELILFYCTFTCKSCLWQKMIEEMTHRLVKLVRGALLPTTLPKSEQNLYGGWDNKTDLSGDWLTQIMHTIRWLTVSITLILISISVFLHNFWLFSVAVLLRACHEALSALEIPNDLLQVIQDLLLDLRVHCLMVTLVHTTEGQHTGGSMSCSSWDF